MKWCGVTSHVAGTPRAFPSLTARSDAAALMCATWYGPPVRPLRLTSRATMIDSVSAG